MRSQVVVVSDYELENISEFYSEDDSLLRKVYHVPDDLQYMQIFRDRRTMVFEFRDEPFPAGENISGRKSQESS